MCSLSLPDFVYPSKSLLIRVGGFPVWDQDTAPGRERATKLHFLPDSPLCRHLAKSISPQLIKSLTGWCKSSSVLLGFKNSYQLRFCWLFRSLVRLAENLCWGQKKVGSAFTYSAAIFQIPGCHFCFPFWKCLSKTPNVNGEDCHYSKTYQLFPCCKSWCEERSARTSGLP